MREIQASYHQAHFSHITRLRFYSDARTHTHTHTHSPRILRDERVANIGVLSNKSGNMANFNELETCSLGTRALCAQNRNKTRNMSKQIFHTDQEIMLTSQKILQ